MMMINETIMYDNNSNTRDDNANYNSNKRVHNDPVDKYHHNEYFMEKLFMSFAFRSLSSMGNIPPLTGLLSNWFLCLE